MRALALSAVTLLLGCRTARVQSVWVIDDGEKIKRDASGAPFSTGRDNPIWRPGAPVRLFALRNETIALQVVVGAARTAFDGVTVELTGLPAAVGVERFVEHFFDVTRPSGSGDRRASLGWSSGSGPRSDPYTGVLPDALIPVEIAPAWSPYPLRVAAGQNGIVWVDLTIPRDLAAGRYTGKIDVAAGGASLATLPVELEVRDAVLPDRPVDTMFYYARDTLERRIGGGEATERQLWQLLHRHRLSALHGVESVAALRAQLPALDGSLYTPADGIVVLGMYGGFGAPSAEKLATVESIADLAAANRLFDGDVFLYAKDEDCDSPYGPAWKAALAGSSNANARRIRVGWTCSTDPSRQPVDLPIVFAGLYDRETAAAARARGREVWIYNGHRPSTGSFLTDAPATDPIVNGWIMQQAGIERWFYWETTFWYDSHKGGRGAIDPFVTAENFHNKHGDWCQGDGVLLYPGRQIDRFTEHSLGFPGVLPSIRLKNLRRGVQDAGYLQLARAADRAAADAIAKRLIPRTLDAAESGDPPSWPERGKPFFEARRALADLIAPAPP